MTGPLFYVPLCFILDTIFELLTLEQAYRDHQFDMVLLVNASALLIHMIMLYILCFFSEKFSVRSYEIGDRIYCDLLWYKLPIRQQKTLILPIRRSQTPFRLNGYGIFDSSFELFLKVIHPEISHFEMQIFKDNQFDIFVYFQIIKTSASWFLIMRQLRGDWNDKLEKWEHFRNDFHSIRTLKRFIFLFSRL